MAAGRSEGGQEGMGSQENTSLEQAADRAGFCAQPALLRIPLSSCHWPPERTAPSCLQPLAFQSEEGLGPSAQGEVWSLVQSPGSLVPLVRLQPRVCPFCSHPHPPYITSSCELLGLSRSRTQVSRP